MFHVEAMKTCKVERLLKVVFQSNHDLISGTRVTFSYKISHYILI